MAKKQPKLSEKATQGKKDKWLKIDAIDIIVEKTGLTRKNIILQVKEKREELKGLISEEGALFIIAKELGVDIKEPKGSLQDAFGNSKEEQHEENGVRVETSQPKITQRKTTLEPSKHPLEVIKIDRSLLTLTEAKEKILEEIELYNFTIQNIVNEKDFAIMPNGNKSICKSGVRKIQLALNISTEIISDKVWKEDGEYIAKYIVKAIAPSGRTATCVGICEQFEKKRRRTRHDTEATAQTRATSRAILDLAGFGAVSKEEIDDSIEISRNTNGDIKDAFGSK